MLLYGMQLKISAEDQDTIHFVRDNLFDCLDHTKVRGLLHTIKFCA